MGSSPEHPNCQQNYPAEALPSDDPSYQRLLKSVKSDKGFSGPL